MVDVVSTRSGKSDKRVPNNSFSLARAKGPDIHHHEIVKGMQERFKGNVTDLWNTTDEMDNSFSDTSGDLLVVDFLDIVDELVIETMRNVEKVVQKQYSLFAAERLEKRSNPITDPFKQSKAPLIGQPPVRVDAIEKLKIVSLKHKFRFCSALCLVSESKRRP